MAKTLYSNLFFVVTLVFSSFKLVNTNIFTVNPVELVTRGLFTVLKEKCYEKASSLAKQY